MKLTRFGKFYVGHDGRQVVLKFDSEQEAMLWHNDFTRELENPETKIESEPKAQRALPSPQVPRVSLLRGRRGSKRDHLMELLRAAPEGLSRGAMLERLGLKGNKAGEMSISNALTALTNVNTVIRGDDRLYRLAELENVNGHKA